MTDNRFDEYPCVNIGDVLHITVSGTTCACGREYVYAKELDSADTLIVRSPLLWRTLSEVDCRKCRYVMEKRMRRK